MNDSLENIDPPNRDSTFLAGLIVLLIFLVPAAGFWWLRGMSRTAVEANLLSHARDMLIRHCVRTDGQWPQSWDDLAEDFEPADANYGTPNLDVLKERVSIDFDIELQPRQDEPVNPNVPLRILWLRGQAASPEIDDLNARLLEYLQTRYTLRQGREDVES